MTPGQQIALQPALAQVLARALPSRGRPGEWSSAAGCAAEMRSVTSNNASRRFDAVSSGPMTRKFRLSAFSRITSRRNWPVMRVASASILPGAAPPRHSRGSRAVEVAQQQPAVGVRVRAHAPVILGCQRGDLAPAAGRRRRTAPRDDSSSSIVRACPGGAGLVAPRRAAPGAPEGALDWLAVDNLRAGPALWRAQDDHRPGRPFAKPLLRASSWIDLISANTASSVPAIC